ncbi:MAG: TlpA disulfide reductase family protein [Deltaproteobacteria bacterium]|nr:TlpA disulfide reductase family protein [Deltaproteobacteria bacterium]
MMQRITCFIVAALLMALSACTKSDPGKGSSAAKENGPAPEISVMAIADNSILKLSELKGRVVLLNFWATWCPPCREEIPSMMKLNKAMAGKPFQMVSVSIDEGGKSTIDSFFKDSGFLLPTYLDQDGRAAKAYGITGVPESFVISKQGIVVKKIIGGIAWDSPDVVSFLEGLMK